MNSLLVIRLATQSMWAHRRQNSVTAFVLGLGAFLFVVGAALLGAMTQNLEQTIISTLAGHLQVYPKSLSGSPDLLQSDQQSSFSEPIADYPAIEARLKSHPNVAAVVPMATGLTAARIGNRLDRWLEQAREAARRRDADGLQIAQRRVVYLVRRLRDEISAEPTAATDPLTDQKRTALAALAKALSPKFWDDFYRKPFAGLEFLENEIAPLGGSGRTLWLKLLCTPVAEFARSFDRFEIVRGEFFAPGSHGIIMGEDFYDSQFEQPVARALDELYREVTEGDGSVSDHVVRARAEWLVDGVPGLLKSLQPGVEEELQAELGRLLTQRDASLSELLRSFLNVTPENLAERYAQFHAIIAPRMELYSVALGEELVLRASGRHGYVTSVSVTLTGIYRFAGAQKFWPLGRFSIADPSVAAELMGVPDAELLSEIDAMRRGAALVAVRLDNIESVLFSDESAIEVEGELSHEVYSDVRRMHTLDEPEPTTVEHAAVILVDADQLRATAAELGAANPTVQLFTWDEAAASVAQYIELIAVQLYIGLGIVLLIAMLMVSVVVVIVTLERRRELATLRAIGARPLLIFGVVVAETVMLGILASTAAAIGASAFVGWIAHVGIPANGAVFAVLFGGTTLRPESSLGQQGLAVAVVAVAAALGAFYPARLATRVPPVAAMTGAGR